MTIERGTGRPKNGYYLADGTRVPSVTTIAGRFKDSDALIKWAFNRGKSGADDLYEDKALDIGSLVHDTIEAEINEIPVPIVPDQYAEPVASAVAAWHEWFEMQKFEFVATEVPLVSETHRFGGTLDTIVRDSKGRLALGDWKTSKAVYGDYLIQLAGYKILWNENREEKLTGGFHLVRFSKQHGDLEHRYFPELNDAELLLLQYRDSYDLVKKVDSRAR